MWIWWNPAPFWPSVRLRGAHPSCASFTVCSLAVMEEQPLRLGVKQLKGKEPGLPCGQQSPAQLLSVSIGSELRTWALLNVELLFVAEVPGGLSLASPHGSPRAASCPLQLWLLPKLQGSPGRGWQLWCSLFAGLVALRCCCLCADFPGTAWLCREA